MTRYSGFYWILVADEPEPAWWDGDGWAVVGGGEVFDPEVLDEDPIVFSPVVPERPVLLRRVVA